MNLEQSKAVILKTWLAALHEDRRPSGRYLVSGPGVGKSESVFQLTEQAAGALGEPVGLVVEMFASYASVDVRGFMLPVKGEHGGLDTVWSVPSWYPKRGNMYVVEPDGTWHKPGAWEEALPRAGILFLDEFAQADEDTQKPAAELILNGRVGTTVLPTGWQVIAAGNRTGDRSGVMRELMFLVNRRCKLTIDPSLPAWLAWTQRQPESTRPHYLVTAFAQKNPDIVFRDTTPDGSEPYATPRSLCLMDRDLKALRSQQDVARNVLPTDGIAKEVAMGWIGEAAANQFFLFMRYADELPDIEDIEANPSRAKVPGGMDAQMVCAYMLSHNLTKDNARNVFKYILRLYDEMQILAVSAVMSRKTNDPEAMKLKAAFSAAPEFSVWAQKHKDVLIAANS